MGDIDNGDLTEKGFDAAVEETGVSKDWGMPHKTPEDGAVPRQGFEQTANGFSFTPKGGMAAGDPSTAMQVTAEPADTRFAVPKGGMVAGAPSTAMPVQDSGLVERGGFEMADGGGAMTHSLGPVTEVERGGFPDVQVDSFGGFSKKMGAEAGITFDGYSKTMGPDATAAAVANRTQSGINAAQGLQGTPEGVQAMVANVAPDVTPQAGPGMSSSQLLANISVQLAPSANGGGYSPPTPKGMGQ